VRQGSYITARGDGAEYSALTQASVISLNALPETLTNPNFCFMSRDATTSQRVSTHPFYGDTFDSGVFEGSRSQLESRANVTLIEIR